MISLTTLHIENYSKENHATSRFPHHRSYRGVGIENRANFLSKIMAVTEQDLVRVGNKYMSTLFDEDKTRTVVVCHPSKINEIQQGFKG